MYSLFLYDMANHKGQYTEDSLLLFLQKINFLMDQNHHFVPSKSFMNLITFLGCSPNLNNEIETKITIKLAQDRQAIGGDSIAKLTCPNCKQKITDPASLIKKFSTNPNWLSLCCQQNIALETINWRKSAGFSHTFIQVSNIFPKEAIPNEEFMHLLADFSQSSWKYFYSKQHIF